jgi:hypothetical protein
MNAYSVLMRRMVQGARTINILTEDRYGNSISEKDVYSFVEWWREQVWDEGEEDINVFPDHHGSEIEIMVTEPFELDANEQAFDYDDLTDIVNDSPNDPYGMIEEEKAKAEVEA